MKKTYFIFPSILCISLICVCAVSFACKSSSLDRKNIIEKQSVLALPKEDFIQTLENKYKDIMPKQWGIEIPGVKTKLDTNEKVLALTFDACGGPKGSGYDRELIDYLVKEKVPATLFINYRWIENNHDTFINLSKNPLFEIENHGYAHKPLSVSGRSAYGITGTENIHEALSEVLLNENLIQRLTGRKPRFFRPGTAFSDEVAGSAVRELGEEVVAFNILGDAGATYSKEQIRKACLSASPGSIIICHMNHPEKQTAEGIKLVIPELKRKGVSFIKLSDYPLK